MIRVIIASLAFASMPAHAGRQNAVRSQYSQRCDIASQPSRPELIDKLAQLILENQAPSSAETLKRATRHDDGKPVCSDGKGVELRQEGLGIATGGVFTLLLATDKFAPPLSLLPKKSKKRGDDVVRTGSTHELQFEKTTPDGRPQTDVYSLHELHAAVQMAWRVLNPANDKTERTRP